MFLLVFLVLIGFAALSATIAANKNRSVLGWALIGFFFSLLGFLAVLMVSEVEEEGETSKSRKEHFPTIKGFDPDEHDKKCPDCAEYIKLEARVCKHCGHEFSDEEVEKQIEEVKEEETTSYSGEPPKAENTKEVRDKL